jgi:hypothetical protein
MVSRSEAETTEPQTTEAGNTAPFSDRAEPVPGQQPPGDGIPDARGWCRNCDAPLTGPYCARCGQRATDYSVSLGVLAKDFADEVLSVDSRLFRSLVALFVRPGFLTRQYLIGRRARFVAPLRLYIVSSLVFFFTLTLIVRPSLQVDTPQTSLRALLESVIEDDTQADTLGAGAARVDTARVGAAGAGASPADTVARVPPTIPDLGTIRVGWWEISLNERLERLGGLTPQQLIDTLVEGFERNLPRMMFVLLPIFALILKLLYVRRRWYYAEHFIFSLHIHAFFFSLFLLVLLLPAGVWKTILLLWGVLYLALAMHHVYRQSLWKTAMKFFLLNALYFTVLIVAVAASVVVTVMLM